MRRVLGFLKRHRVAAIFGAGFVALAAYTTWNLSGNPRDPRLERIRKAGYPVTLSELQEYYSAVPENQNAALVYERAFQSEMFTNHLADDLTSAIVTKRGDPLPDDFRAELAAALASNAAPYELLYAATNLTGSRYPPDLRDGYLTLLPHLAKIKQAAMLLSLEGLAHASAGESNQAYAAFNAAFQISDSLQNEPVLISFLVRIVCAKLVARRLEESLNLVGLQEPQLRSLQERFSTAKDQPWPARALAGERAFGLSFFIDRKIQRSITEPQKAIGGLPSGFSGSAAITLYRATGLMGKDENFYLDAMSKIVAFAEKPADERIQDGPAPNLITSNRLMVLSRLLLPALQQSLNRADEHSARMRVMETGVAVERFRIRHSGAVPEKLADLVPECLERVPLDPYDSQPLRYKKLPRGFVVYSIGPDRHDDGGAEPPVATKGGNLSKAIPQDVTFIIERK